VHTSPLREGWDRESGFRRICTTIGRYAVHNRQHDPSTVIVLETYGPTSR
jgi:hypothetical protein